MALNTTGENKHETGLMPRETWRPTLNLLGICCASVVGVDLLCRSALVEGNEPLQKVVASSVVVITTSVVREVISQRRAGKLLHEQVNFVQEQDLEET